MKYLHVILIILISSFLSTTADAKKPYGSDLGIGVKGGLNLNKTKGEGLTAQYKTDPHVGLFCYLNKSRLGLHIESMWTQNHITTDTSFRGIYKQYVNQIIDSLQVGTFRFSTIALPLLVNIKFAEFLWLQVGPQFNANISVTDKNNWVKSGLQIIAQQQYHAVAGVWIQLGGDSPLLKVNLGARFMMSLNNLNALNESLPWKNQQIQLHLGIGY